MKFGIGRVLYSCRCQSAHSRMISNAMKFAAGTPLIGHLAKKLLGQGACRGRVVASVSGAVYLRLDNGQITWLVEPGSLMHPRCVRSSAPLARQEAGTAFTVRNDVLELHSGDFTDLSSCTVWDPPDFACNGFNVKQAAQTARRVTAEVCARRAGAGLSPFLCAPSGGYPAAGKDLVLDAVLPVLESIQAAVKEHDFARILSSGRQLVGFGAGLTPSGDDFLGGLLFTFFYLRQCCPSLFSDDDDKSITQLLSFARSQTNEISYTLLEDLSIGIGFEPLPEVVYSILNGKDYAFIEPFIEQLADIGNSTGWDLLTGVLTGILWTFDPGPAVDLPEMLIPDMHCT